MTREEAIKILNTVLFFGKCDCPKEEIEECLKMAIKALEQEPQTFKWCTDCKEYDQEKHCCHRWSKVIRDTVEEMKQEQEPFKPMVEIDLYSVIKQKYIEREVLDKIRAELHATAEMHMDGDYYLRDEWIDEYFDKYKAETEAE